MHMIALLSGADPQRCGVGPTVRLRSGTWRLNVQGLVDSKLVMHVQGYETANEIYNLQKIYIDSPEYVTLRFSVRGSEKYITVLAECIE